MVLIYPDYAKIITYDNGHEIVGILESQGFTHLLSHESHAGDIFYFRREAIIAKIIAAGSFIGKERVVSVRIYLETFNLNSAKDSNSKPELLKIRHIRSYIDTRTLEEFIEQLDSITQIENECVLVDNFERHSKYFNKQEILSYLEERFTGLSRSHIIGNFALA